MKQLMTLFVVSLMALSLAACATSQPKQVKVKCPACGYEFMTPVGD